MLSRAIIFTKCTLFYAVPDAKHHARLILSRTDLPLGDSSFTSSCLARAIAAKERKIVVKVEDD